MTTERLVQHLTYAGHEVEEAHRALGHLTLPADLHEDINHYLLGIARDLRAIQALISQAMP